MKSSTLKKCWIASSLLLLFASPLLAGVVYEIEVKDHEQSPPKTESIQAAVEGRHLKMGIASGGQGAQGEMIFRGDRREMLVIDHDTKSYHQIDEEAMGAIAGQLGDVQSQLSDAERMMREALKNVPADQRTMVEEMMKKRMPAVPETPKRTRSELRKTSERGEKSGYPCVKYEVYKDDRKIRELWVTDWSNVEGGSDVVGAFEEMADFFSEMMDSFAAFGGQGGNPMGDPAFEHMRELGGFPVVTREFDEDGSLEGESTLRSARRATLDPDDFEPPSGYKRQEMFSP